MKGLGMRLSLTLPQGLHSGSQQSGHTQQMSPPPPFVLLLQQCARVLEEVKDILASYEIAKLRGKKLMEESWVKTCRKLSQVLVAPEPSKSLTGEQYKKHAAMSCYKSVDTV